MNGLAAFFVVVLLSLLVTRVASIALMLTGLSESVARFQARSALTGCGFTTDESNQLVRHPVRRKIVSFLMLLGSAGFVTAISSLLLTFTSDSGPAQWRKFGILVLGLFFIWALAHRFLRRLFFQNNRFSYLSLRPPCHN